MSDGRNEITERWLTFSGFQDDSHPDTLGEFSLSYVVDGGSLIARLDDHRRTHSQPIGHRHLLLTISRRGACLAELLRHIHYKTNNFILTANLNYSTTCEEFLARNCQNLSSFTTKSIKLKKFGVLLDRNKNFLRSSPHSEVDGYKENKKILKTDVSYPWRRASHLQHPQNPLKSCWIAYRSGAFGRHNHCTYSAP